MNKLNITAIAAAIAFAFSAGALAAQGMSKASSKAARLVSGSRSAKQGEAK